MLATIDLKMKLSKHILLFLIAAKHINHLYDKVIENNYKNTLFILIHIHLTFLFFYLLCNQIAWNPSLIIPGIQTHHLFFLRHINHLQTRNISWNRQRCRRILWFMVHRKDCSLSLWWQICCGVWQNNGGWGGNKGPPRNC